MRKASPAVSIAADGSSTTASETTGAKATDEMEAAAPKVLRFKLIAPSTSEVWETPANESFDQEEILWLLNGLRERGHEFELIDGDASTDQERRDLYGEAFIGLANAGNRYRIRQVFGSRRHGGGDHLGKGVPALIVFEDDEPVDVYPHQVGENYQTIRAYLESL